MQISIITLQDIKQAKRFDAEYFKPEYLNDDFNLEKKGFFTLSEIADVKGGKRLPLWESFSNEGVPYIRAEDIKNDFVQYENVPRISFELHEKLKNYQTKKNDVLLTIVGSVGAVGFVQFDIDKCNLTENAAKITNTKNINPFIIFVYMLSKYGQNQIHREKVWTVQEKLALERIRRFKIAKFDESFQLEIEKIVKEAYQKQFLSKQLYKEAEQLLLEELGLLDYKPKHTLTFTATKKEIDQAKRYDAEYFQLKYKEIIKKIEEYEGWFNIVWNIFNWKKWVEVWSEAYTEEGKDFVRVSDFSKFGIENVSKKIDEKLFEKLKQEHQAKKWEILFTKDWTIGISYVLKEDLDWILSSAFLRLTLKEKYQDFEKEVLALIFNSIISKLQVEQLSGWALIAHLKPSDFENLKIPLLKTEIQKQISQKIEQNHRLRKESKELLEQAKKIVEEEIEK